MIAVIFEVEPKKEQKAEYFDLAKSLKPFLSEMDGFISIERFQSLSEPNKVLSLSFWEDEDSIMRWKSQIFHKEAQEKGKKNIFHYYRIRVANVVRDYDMKSSVNRP